MPPDTLPPMPTATADELATRGIRSRILPGINGLAMHLLEAGFEQPGRPAVLLLHGFPELAYSWRQVLPALAAAGYHAIAPDQRGYGRTTGWDARYEAPIAPYRMLNLARDALGLVNALGLTRVAAVVGHDFGSPVAAWCALLRPDVFGALVLMSAPFGGPPSLPPMPPPARTADALAPPANTPAITPAGTPPGPLPLGGERLHQLLGTLARPRQHYQWYYGTPGANANLWRAPQGVHDFLRAYYHHKSADWPGNQPQALPSWCADDLARLPTYYVMDRGVGMAETVAPEMPGAAQIAACHWLPDAALAYYASEYQRTGFQGGLNWYRAASDTALGSELQLFAGRTIEVPALFIAGAQDWGIHQKPGELARMQSHGCAQLLGCHLLPGAGHWVQQEQAEAVNRLLIDFLQRAQGQALR